MKKVFVILMAVVMMVAINTALAEKVVKNGNLSEVYGWVCDYASENGIYDKYNNTFENWTYYTMGVIDLVEFEEMYGPWSVDAMVDVLGSDDYPYDIIGLSIRVVGDYNGYDVYEMDVTSKTPLGSYCEVDYYHGVVLFMVCEEL